MNAFDMNIYVRQEMCVFVVRARVLCLCVLFNFSAFETAHFSHTHAGRGCRQKHMQHCNM